MLPCNTTPMDIPRRRGQRLKRQLDSIIIHFDYDAFYASVIEAETPSLRARPLAVQQKQIVVTCNYEARRRGLYKLQLITEAKKTCPDVVIVLGEDLTRFRNASKELYAFLRSFSWNSRCERLGFDEVWMDVTDIVDYNVRLLNQNDLANTFFCLSKTDPTEGFAFDASGVAGHTYPEVTSTEADAPRDLWDPLRLRLHLGSHLAQHLRQKLVSKKGYTCTVGVSTNKLLCKLVGNVHKPSDQTTLLPPYTSEDGCDNVTSFIDEHEVGKIPGIGFKLAQKLRAHVLQQPADFDSGLVYGGTNEKVLVRDIRTFSDMGPETLERILGGPGTPHGIGAKVWGLLNGCDDTEVGQARDVPTQISIEDSYVRLVALEEVTKELLVLSRSLLRRMHADLLDDDEDLQVSPNDGANIAAISEKRWLAFPKTIRLSTRPRPPQNPDGSRNRSFARISRSAPMPNFVFSLKDGIEVLAERLVKETLVPLFRKLHPEKSGWNLSLVNVAATGMVDAASEKGGVGRDIGKMLKRQGDVLKQWKVYDTGGQDQTKEEVDVSMQVQDVWDEKNLEPSPPPPPIRPSESRIGSEDIPTPSQELSFLPEDRWESEDEDMLDDDSYRCEECGGVMPIFAMGAHARWHAQN
ncbi:DNA/RNA polymerase [Lentithecium fluviatile CBS 122367]|uniref:DNA/RNA polymerase n=1 Tax=Lentithecium fluviatile CBS 122367 TaxID=1168545 RepID=A0A6G1JGM8_9PLEO|nr:DNA/RNA polymerase [Lentithecium fluviatile CBS 122367]